MEQLRIELSEDRQWQWKTYGCNGENTATSETYTRKHDAERGFNDHAVAMLKILHDQGVLFAMLAMLGIDQPAAKSEFIGTRPPFHPPPTRPGVGDEPHEA